MARESKQDRAVRLLREHRLAVERAEPGGIVIASCRGDSGSIHRLGWDPRRKEWRCTCEANAKFRRECAHLVALKHVVVRP